MRCLLQRVKLAELKVEDKSICKIEKGILAYIGFCDTDNYDNIHYVMDRLSKIRLFEDDKGRLNLSLSDVGARAMIVPNFTLYADATTGRRPSFTKAMDYNKAKEYFDYACDYFDKIHQDRAERGIFGGDMQIDSIADGPINIWIEN